MGTTWKHSRMREMTANRLALRAYVTYLVHCSRIAEGQIVKTCTVEGLLRESLLFDTSAQNEWRARAGK